MGQVRIGRQRGLSEGEARLREEEKPRVSAGGTLAVSS